jgi:hypothetical protein
MGLVVFNKAQIYHDLDMKSTCKLHEEQLVIHVVYQRFVNHRKPIVYPMRVVRAHAEGQQEGL